MQTLFTQQLFEDKSFLKETYEYLPIGIGIADTAGAIVFANKSYFDMFGYSLEEIHDIQTWSKKCYPDIEYRNACQKLWDEDIASAIANGTPAPSRLYNIINKSGNRLDIEIAFSIVNEYILCVFNDVSKIQKIEAKYELTEKRLTRAVEASSDAIWEWDIKKNNLTFSPQWYGFLGIDLSIDSSDTHTWEKLCHQDDLENAMRIIENYVSQSSDEKLYIEARMKHSDGSWIWTALRGGVAERNENGEPFLICGTCSVITNMKQKELALKASEEKYSTLFQLSPVAIILTDIEIGNILEVNDQLLKSFGFSRDEIKGESTLSINFWANPIDRNDFILKLKQYGKISGEEYTFLRKDGNKLEASINAQVVTFNDKPCILSSFIDLTVQKESERALEEKLALLNSIYKTDPSGKAITKDRKYLSANPRHCEILGYSENEMIGKSTRFLYATDAEYDRVGRDLYTSLNENGIGKVESRWIRKDGKTIDVYLIVSPIDPNDSSKGLMSILMDITEIKVAERKLKQSQQEFYSLFSNMQEGVALHKLIYDDKGAVIDYLILEVNNSFQNQTGISNDLAKNKLATELYQMNPPPYLKEYTLVVQTGVPLQFSTYFEPLNKHFHISVIRIEEDHFATIFFDVTENVIAKEALQKSEENLRITLLSIGDAVIATDTKGGITMMNPIAERMTGWDIISAQGKNIKDIFKIVNANTRKTVENPIEKVLQIGEIVGLANHTVLIAKDGAEYQIADSGAPIKDPKGAILGAVLVFRDVTEDYQIQRQLEMSEMQFRSIFENAPYSIAIISDANNIYLNVNKKFLQYSGYEYSELIGTEVIDKITEDQRITFEDWKRQIRDINNADDRSGFIITKDNRELSTITNSNFIKYNGEDAIIIMALDVTEHLKLEEQLRQSQKMDAVGQLAGGIAHDFNNMLAAILNSAELLQLYTLDENKRAKYVQLIIDATTRASELTKKMLAFARKGFFKKESISIHSIIDATIDILSRSIDKKIQISTRFSAKFDYISGDFTQIMNVFMNLGINAAHAMPNGGNLFFSTRNINLDKLFCKNSAFDIKPGNYILIETQDSGCGMPTEILPKIFEPFFTTKEQGKGTGLGLSLAYGTIAQHGGAIHVYSEVAKGSVFHIYLPITDQELKFENIIEDELLQGEGAILVVDDEEILRETAQDILSNLGYSVFTAENGKRGVEVYLENREQISLVILDMIMPVMDGKECFFKLKEINPNLKIIISSGFSKEEDIEELKKSGLDSFIKKPYHTATLSKLIAETLKK